MTTALATAPVAETVETVETAETPAPRSSVFLSKAIRTTGYARVATGAIAAGDFNGQRAHLVLPIERIAAADVRLRSGGTKLAINVNSASPYADLATAAATRAARVCGLEFGEVVLNIRPPVKPSNGTDPAEAVVLAVLDAIDKATEFGMRPNTRSAIVTDLFDGHCAGLAVNEPAIIGAGGVVLSRTEATVRLVAVVCQPIDGGESISDLNAGAAFGTLTTAPTGVTDPRVLADWLVYCSGESDEEHAAAVRGMVKGIPEVLGVIGGHTANSPVVVLLPRDHLSVAQDLSPRLSHALPDGWRASPTRTSIAD